MSKITVNDLLEAGVHFGHQTKRWNPKMKEFVFGEKNGIYIIDLTKTMRCMADAYNFLQGIVSDGKDVLFVGTKRQAQELICEAAEKTDMFYVSERWLGGTLTNNKTIQKSISKMQELDKLLESEEISGMRKKELSSISRKAAKLHRNLDGIAGMKKLPGAVVIVDSCHEDTAVREARKLKIPVVAIIDTNGDPEEINYPIAANDDSLRSIKIIIDLLADGISDAALLYRKKAAEEEAKRRKEEEEKKKKAATEKKAKAEDDKKKKGAPPKKKEADSGGDKKGESKHAAPKEKADTGKTSKPEEKKAKKSESESEDNKDKKKAGKPAEEASESEKKNGKQAETPAKNKEKGE